MKKFRAAVVAAFLPLGTLLVYPPTSPGQKPFPPAIPFGGSLVQVQAQAPAPTNPVITLFDRQAQVIPTRKGYHHTGGGNMDVIRPGPDIVVINMTGIAVAGAHPFHNSVASQDFNLVQEFEVALERPQGRKLSLIVEARVVGLLRSHKGRGQAEESGMLSIRMAKKEIVTLAAPAHSVAGGENLSVNDHIGPVAVPIGPGKYTWHQTFHVSVSHPCSLLPHKASSAEFASDPALDPIWISYFEPFHGAIKKDFGYQVAVKMVAE